MNEYSLAGIYDGQVIDNRDPLLIGRLKVVVPGVLEPVTDWVYPVCYPGASSDGRGFWCIPQVGANISVMFCGGDVDEPRYLPGPWAAPNDDPKSPSFVRDLTPSEAVEITGLQTTNWEITCDDREGKSRLTIRDRATGSNVISIDGENQTVAIEGTVAIQIKSLGVVNIEAMQIVLNGRPVLPTGKPI